MVEPVLENTSKLLHFVAERPKKKKSFFFSNTPWKTIRMMIQDYGNAKTSRRERERKIEWGKELEIEMWYLIIF